MSRADLLKWAPQKPTLIRPKQQPNLLLLLLAVIGSVLCSALMAGTIKPWAKLDWIDILGEGATCLACFLWLFFTVAKRPAGPVTNGLSLGFALLTFSFAMDVVDEFIHTEASWWGKPLESVTSPLAIFVLTGAAFGLYREQKVLQRQQQRREAHFRDHSAIDPVTDLYNAEYFRSTLAACIEDKNIPQILLVDLQSFDAINTAFGFSVGDQVLNRVGHTLVATMPEDSLVCRYAGDRFAIITKPQPWVPKLETVLGQLLSSAMTMALYQTIEQELACPVRVVQTQPRAQESADQAIARANRQLEAQK